MSLSWKTYASDWLENKTLMSIHKYETWNVAARFSGSPSTLRPTNQNPTPRAAWTSRGAWQQKRQWQHKLTPGCIQLMTWSDCWYCSKNFGVGGISAWKPMVETVGGWLQQKELRSNRCVLRLLSSVEVDLQPTSSPTTVFLMRRRKTRIKRLQSLYNIYEAYVIWAWRIRNEPWSPRGMSTEFSGENGHGIFRQYD